jgi:hypothetical protein
MSLCQCEAEETAGRFVHPGERRGVAASEGNEVESEGE